MGRLKPTLLFRAQKTFFNSLLQPACEHADLPVFSESYGEFVAWAMSQNPHEQAEAYSTQLS
jgi:hypothetical protein